MQRASDGFTGTEVDVERRKGVMWSNYMVLNFMDIKYDFAEISQDVSDDIRDTEQYLNILYKGKETS